MPLAIFQCDTANTALEVKHSISNYKLPVYDLEFWIRGRIFMLTFLGDCVFMYRFCMDLVPRYGHRIAFIGIDETKQSPHDEYKINSLDIMPYDPSMRKDYQQSAFKRVINDFIPAVQGSKFSWDACLTIAERCVLGVDTNQSVDFCTQITIMMSNMHHSRPYIDNFFATLSPCAWATDCSFTFGRVMTHWCYLRLRKFKK